MGRGDRDDDAQADSRRNRVAMNLLDTNFLFASLIWGSIGVGYIIYGRKQRAVMPLIAGTLMVAASYFAGSALSMSAICLALMGAVYYLAKQGY